VLVDTEADICAANVTSALPPKADTCGATGDVGYGPKADMRSQSGI